MLAVNYSKDIYGHQHATIFCCSEDTISNIQSRSDVQESICFFRNVYENDYDSNIYINYVIDQIPSNYFNFTEYELVSGKMPETETEILCQSSYLLKLGFNYDEMLNSQINISGKKYSVVGIYTVNRLWKEWSLPEHHFFTGNPTKYNSIAFSMNDYENCNSLINEEQYSSFSIECNDNIPIIISNKNDVYQNCFFIFILVVLTVLIVFSHCISMLLHEQRKNIKIYQLIGISTNKITTAIWLCIGKMICMSLFTSVLLLLLLVHFVMIFYHRLFIWTIGTDIFTTSKLIACFVIPFTISIIYVLSTWLAIKFKIKKANYEIISNKHSIKLRKKSKSLKITDQFIAKRHLTIAKGSTVFTTICICFVSLSFVITNIYFTTQKKTIQNIRITIM